MKSNALKELRTWAAVVTQLAEQSLPIPEVRGSNLVISEILKWACLLLAVKKTKIKKKRLSMAHLKKKCVLLSTATTPTIQRVRD